MSLLNPVKTSFQFGKSTVTLETARIARQATGAVLCTIDEKTSVLATVVASKSTKPGQDFFPLSVHYIEKQYAVGKIPGGYLKREGRPSEKETLTSRLIDRPIRPLFPKGFMNEVQVVLTVVSATADVDPDICEIIKTSAALSISGVPFKCPIGAARVAYTEEAGYSLNPLISELEASDLDMVVAGTSEAVLMVESEAKELSEDEMLGAVLFAHAEFQAVIKAVAEFEALAGKEKWVWAAAPKNEALIAQVTDGYATAIGEAYQISDKAARYEALGTAKKAAIEAFSNEETDADEISGVFASIEKATVRTRIVNGEPRIDGRDASTVREIEVEVGVLPGAHGSALFTRGETQALVTATLGTLRDGKMEETVNGKYTDHFMLHYNFPPYSVGECGRMGGTGRREIGHGRLARRGVAATLPKVEDFPYTVRIVSEITESNGSSSMASVCGASLAMMDAGVPVTTPVAGIAMGLVKEGDKFAVLTDILGDEDHLGDMDFKVAGSAKGITALQMDIKIEGITEEIMELALDQANTARNTILREMAKVIGYARPELPDNAPSMTTVKVHPDKIRDIIGKGGATIRSICEETGAEVDIDDEGLVRIYSPSKENTQAALDMIKEITAEAEIGKLYAGKVMKIADFGAFVNFLPGKDGLVHISQICDRRLEKVSEELTEGQEVVVKCLDVDNRGRIKLSIKEVSDAEKAEFLGAVAASEA
ncbi:MAG: polyribonucleotide nucleotidyltransferase [Saccharospirillaceae bacterium]|nr:polyribonucleotide nucleotidyltransferase [Saccharospirillaceae bacterium]